MHEEDEGVRTARTLEKKKKIQRVNREDSERKKTVHKCTESPRRLANEASFPHLSVYYYGPKPLFTVLLNAVFEQARA